MKAKRIISSLLAVLMLLSACAFSVSADEAVDTAPAGRETTNTEPTIDYFSGKEIDDLRVNGATSADWQPVGEQVIYTETDKLNTMTRMLEKGDYVLYVDKFSGEVAVYCKSTGESLFTNPYSIADSTAADTIKAQLMSQLVINYTDIESGQSYDFYSYTEAVRNEDEIKGQINVRNIKNGIRVEYTIGREEARLLVPELISKERFETEIMEVALAAIEQKKTDAIENGVSEVEATRTYNADKFKYDRLMAYYKLQDPNAVSGTVREDIYKKYPVTKSKGIAVYALDGNTTRVQKAQLESFIKEFCPDYSYEDLDNDHLETEHVAADKNPPLFKMALEYSLDDTGMTVRLPANGIRFNEALYQLNSIQILPYMGAGAYSDKDTSTFVNNEGYTFFPDGSGSLFDFAKVTDIGKETAIKGKVYGQDYAYHTITGTHQEIIRYPVFGVVRSEDAEMIAYNKALDKKQAELDAIFEALGEEEQEKMGDKPEDAAEYVAKPATKSMNTSGYLAIVEEGDALMEISTYHAVLADEYNTMQMTVYPRPQDTYSIADAVSVGEAGAEWTVVSSRKYTGNYKIKYVLLTENANEEQYDCSYVGMAKAYRDYLEGTGVLTKLTSEDVKEDIPLYIETFGALYTTERILSIPVQVMTPLTTFDDIVTMRDELAAEGIENINFIMTGYTKGGLSTPQVPYNLKWENAVSEDYNFKELVADAKDKDYGVYPDFDFAYSQSNGLFDGLTLSKHSVKTIDDRYTTRREYSATKQTYVSYFDIAVSPAYYSHFYEKLTENYLDYEPLGISVSTLGSALNSDFDEDEPYNREDSKAFTIKAMQYLDENYSKVLTSGGNAFTWKYVDYITDVALDSSRFSQAYASVPFLGMVLHGYVEIAGTPLNMEGNIDYAILKAIESGASLNFILSYQNTNNLKNYENLSKYYSVMYDIWFDDVVDIYSEVNSALAGVQTSTIIWHDFISGERIPDDDEIMADAEAALNAVVEGQQKYEADLAEYEIDKVRNARERLDYLLETYNTSSSKITTLANTFKLRGQINFAEAVEWVIRDKKDLNAAKDTNGEKAAQDTYDLRVNTLAGDQYLKAYNDAANALLVEYVRLAELVESIANGDFDVYAEIIDASAMSSSHKAEYATILSGIEADFVTVEKRITDACEAIENNGNDTDLGTDVFAAVNNVTASKIFSCVAESVFDIKYDHDSDGGATTAEVDLYSDDELAELMATLPAMPVYTDNAADTGKTVIEGDALIAVEDMKAQDPKAPEVFKAEDIEVRSYESDTNKIVYEVYENGTAFILNFNNYTVKVNLGATTYTIGAYGYVMLSVEA